MYRFTIRDILWLTALVALGVGWWLDHRRLAPLVPQHRELIARFTSLHEQVEADGISVYRDPNGPGVVVMRNRVYSQSNSGPSQMPPARLP